MALLWPPPFSAAVGRVVLVLAASIASFAPRVDAVLVRSSASGHVSQRVTPVEQVTTLLKGLSAKVKEEGAKEAAQYDKFACYCKEQADEKLYALQKAEAAIKKLDATITKLDGEMDALNVEISTTSDSIKAANEAIQNATELRSDQQDAYNEESDRIDSCMAALEAAIEAIKSSKAAMQGDVKLDLRALSSTILREASEGLLSGSERQSFEVMSSGKPHAYEYSSNNVLEMLQDLLRKLKKHKHEDIDETERVAQQEFELKVQGLSNEVKFSKDAKLENERVLASKAEARSAADEERLEEGKVKQASESFLQDLQNECESKAQQWDSRSKARSEELQVLGQAIEAIETGVAPNWKANKKLVDLQQAAKGGNGRRLQLAPSAFLQLNTKSKTESRKDSKGSSQQEEGSASSSAKMIQTKVLSTLASAAARLRSPALSMLVMKVQASDDHFVKVRGLIKDLLRRLSDDKSDEADQKQYCDKHMNEATNSRDTNAQTVETKTGEIAVKTSAIEKLNGEIIELQKDVAASKKALGEAAELRSEESTNNQRTLKEAEEGKKAVQFAITVLTDFYGEASSLVQVSSKVAQPPYSRKATDAIFGLLNVILSDFDRTLSKVSSDENSAGEDYDDMRSKTEADIEADEGAIEDKQGEITTLTSDITDLEDEKKSAEENKEAAEKELEALKKQCVEGESWDDRSSAREKEVEALKEALEILDQWQG